MRNKFAFELEDQVGYTGAESDLYPDWAKAVASCEFNVGIIIKYVLGITTIRCRTSYRYVTAFNAT